jgi:hypothetical protein
LARRVIAKEYAIRAEGIGKSFGGQEVLKSGQDAAGGRELRDPFAADEQRPDDQDQGQDTDRQQHAFSQVPHGVRSGSGGMGSASPEKRSAKLRSV